MPTDSSKAAERKKQADQMKMRQALNNAYGALDGQRYTQSIAAVTFEAVVDQMIDRIVGPSTKLRPNEMDRTLKIEKDLFNLLENIKATPPENFISPDASKDVNKE